MNPQGATLFLAAHPDDEYYCAATLYHLARHLAAPVDQMVITDGAGGHRFAGLAGAVYGLDLSEGGKDHGLLPVIRREESQRASRLLGLRETIFLGQPDPGFTLDAAAAEHCWDLGWLERRLLERLLDQDYAALFVIAPEDQEHGHHKAVCRLAQKVLALLPAQRRPVLVGAQPGHSARGPACRPPAFQFSRSRPVPGAESLTYSVIVNWLIAEYKSQGLFQLEAGRHDCERFWILPPSDDRVSSAFLDQLALYPQAA
ncbi:MAG: PIG-L family deacetylase [Bryobacter sp.]|jgi:LmbE family N-acetylglucosaminyl deacetylase|nr:PIG-L family deacetylase [Bryobacter sp. CoA8 C33]